MDGTMTTESTGSATGGCRILLRLEGLTLFLGMTLLYAVWGGSWWVYSVLFLVPDISIAAYLSGPKFGAMIYNAMHSYMAPMTLMVVGLGMAAPMGLPLVFVTVIGFLGTGIDYLILHDIVMSKSALHKVLMPVIGVYSDVKFIVQSGMQAA